MKKKKMSSGPHFRRSMGGDWEGMRKMLMQRAMTWGMKVKDCQTGNEELDHVDAETNCRVARNGCLDTRSELGEPVVI